MKWESFIVNIVIFLLLIAFVAYVESSSFDKGYKAACQDFYNGKLKYEVVEKTVLEFNKINK